MINRNLIQNLKSVNRNNFIRSYSSYNKEAPKIPQKTTHDELIEEHRKSGLTTPHPPKDVLTAEVISGAPGQLIYDTNRFIYSYASLETLQRRQVRIYKPTKNTMQSGVHNTFHWRVDFDILQGGGRWEHPLMGWSSS